MSTGMGTKVDLLRIEPEKDEELAMWLDSMPSEQRTRFLLCSVRGYSQRGPRLHKPSYLSASRLSERKRPWTEGSVGRHCCYNVKEEKEKLDVLQVSELVVIKQMTSMFFP
jgi:hypothetical protein